MNQDNNAASLQKRISPIEIEHLFTQLAPQDVEQFYQAYQLWTRRQKIKQLQQQQQQLQLQIDENAVLMQQAQPSTIALAALAQLQSMGVSDIDLLDRMLARGEDWLDHTMQLLARCEELGVIRDDYTQWCKHALEGAYEWMASMSNGDITELTLDENAPHQAEQDEQGQQMPLTEATEDLLLQKLMSEDREDDTESNQIAPLDLQQQTEESQQQHEEQQAEAKDEDMPVTTAAPLPEDTIIEEQEKDPTTVIINTEPVQENNESEPTISGEEITPAEQIDTHQAVPEEMVSPSIDKATTENPGNQVEKLLNTEETEQQAQPSSTPDAIPQEETTPPAAVQDITAPQEKPTNNNTNAELSEPAVPITPVDQDVLEPTNGIEQPENPPNEQPREEDTEISPVKVVTIEHTMKQDKSEEREATPQDELIQDNNTTPAQWPFRYAAVAQAQPENQPARSLKEEAQPEQQEQQVSNVIRQWQEEKAEQGQQLKKPHDEISVEQRGFFRRSLAKILGR